MNFTEALMAGVARIDGWANLLTGVGASNTAATGFAHQRTGSLSQITLESLYDEDAYAARVCETVPQECLRPGFRVVIGDSAAEKGVKSRLELLCAVPAIRRAWTMARLFGGAVCVLGVRDGLEPSQPVDRGAVKSISYVTPIDRTELSTHSIYEDPLHPDYGLPSVYRVSRGSRLTLVHASRVLRFEGASVTDRRRRELQGWGESVLLRPYQQLQQWGGVYASTSSVLATASESVFKIKDLWLKIAQDQDGLLRRRIELLDLSRSVAKSILIDSDEEFSRVETGQLTGFSDLIGRYAEWLAGACGIPVTLLLGQAPAGLNATGDSDLRFFYDRSEVQRGEILKPQLDKLVRLILLSQDGPTQGAAAAHEIVFDSFYQETEEQKFARRKTQSEIDSAYLAAGVLRPDEVRASRFGGSSWSSDTALSDSELQQSQGTTDEIGAAHTLSPDAADLIMRVTESVCSRAMPRAQGVAVLAHGLGITPDEASALLADSGQTYFTTPAPEHVRELDELRAEHSRLRASDRARKSFLDRVLATNREGRVWTGLAPAEPPDDERSSTEGEQ